MQEDITSERNTNQQEGSSYSQILRSSSIIGGAQVTTLAIGLLRTKAIAVLIGPAGIGLVGIYQSIISFASTLAGLGISTSAVGEIAKHHKEQDETGIARTAITIRRICWIAGTVGAATLAIASPLVDKMTFGSQQQTATIASLSFCVFLNTLVGGQTAKLQGTRRIADLARVRILGAIAGTTLSIAIYSQLGIEGIAPALIATSLASLLISSSYADAISLPRTVTTWKQSFRDASSLLKLGGGVVGAGVIGAAATYVVKTTLAQQLDLQAVGIYTAAYGISGMFVQAVLQAMGTDFYPRLAAESDNHHRMSQLINEQIEVSLFLAFPGLLLTQLLAPIAVTALYSSAFSPATGLLRWFIFGCFFRVLNWPLAFAILAKKRGHLFVASALVSQSIHLVSLFLLTTTLGLSGAAIAFLVMQIGTTAFTYAITRRQIQLSLARETKWNLLWMLSASTASLLLLLASPTAYGPPVVTLLFIASTAYCLHQLRSRLPRNHKISRYLNMLLSPTSNQ